ncbi:MAG: ferrous iron transport protein A [Candidatus Atribacteria bacterium]|nr:ferrous iron transport protein A [Candidatus Atribacteria bacterium]
MLRFRGVERNSFPIAYLRSGNCAVIKDINAGMGLRRRLEEMGLIRGKIIRIVKNDWGPLIITVGEARLIISRGVAFKIMGEEIRK